MADRIQHRRDTAANWALYNPVLLDGEIGVEKDTDQWKMGDGVHTWSQLPYRGGELVQQSGQSTTVGMSQKAVTDLVGLYEKNDYSFSDTQSVDIHSSYLKSGNTILILPSDIILNGNHLGSEDCYASKNDQWVNLGRVHVGKVNKFDLEDDYDFVRVGVGWTYDLSKGSYKIYKTDSIQGSIVDLEEKEKSDISSIHNNISSIHNNLSELNTFVDETNLDLDYVFYGHNNDEPTFSYEDAKKIVRGLCVLSNKYFGTNTDYWTLAVVTVTSTEIGFIIYEKLTNGSWNRNLNFWVKKSAILSLDEGFYKIYGDPLDYLIVDISELKKKVNNETVFSINDLHYKIRPCYFADGFYKNEASLNMPIGMDKRTVFKNKNYFSPVFREAFLDVRYNGEYDPTKGYGFVYIAIRQNGIYFENYCWDLETGAWSSIGDDFTIHDSITTQDKIQYYKSPNGKYEILANFSKLYKDAPDQIPSGEGYVLIAAQKFLEFEDRVFAFRESPHLIDLYLLNKKDLIYSIEDGRQSAGYPDSKMISDRQFEIRDDSDIRDFETYSVIQWCRVAYEAFIDTVTLDLVYAPDSRCVIKIFNSTDDFADALNENVGTKIFDRVITTGDYIDTNLHQARVTIPNKVYVEKGKIIAAIYINRDGGEGSTIHIRHIWRDAPYTPIQDGTPFWWKEDYARQNYVPSSIQPEFAYYQLPLLFNSNFPLEKRVDKLEKDTANIDFDANNPRLVLPSKLYALVGKEFNLYYDAFALLPDLGTPQPNMLFDITCSIGATKARCFRLTPTANQVGEYPMTIRVYSSFEKLLATAQTTLVVVPVQNPSSQKRILCIGDSTTDDTAQVVFGIRNNLDEISGGVSPLLVGHKPYYNNLSVNHGAATGKNFGFFADGATVLKINMVNLPNDIGVYPNLVFTLMDNTGYIVNVRTELQGSGKAYSIASVWSAGSSPVDVSFTGQLRTNGQAGFPSVVDVESVEVLSGYSPFRYNGNLDFAQYATSIGLSNNEKIDLLSIDLGINDSRGAIQSVSYRVTVLNQAKALAEAFHSYNPNGKVMFCLPKSCANPRSNNSAQHDTYRINIHALRENLIKTFDGNSDYPYCYVCNSGLSIDRFYGYSLTTEPVAARYTETIVVNTDDVHPRDQGYNQVADSMVSCMLYILNL